MWADYAAGVFAIFTIATCIFVLLDRFESQWHRFVTITLGALALAVVLEVVT